MTTLLGTPQRLTTTLYVAQGPAGPAGQPGAGSAVSAIADGPIGGHRMVVTTGIATVGYADHMNISHILRVVGLTTNAADDGGNLAVITAGYVDESSWLWVAEEPVFLAGNGQLTQDLVVVSNAAFIQCVGHAVDAQRILVRLYNPIDTSAFLT